MPSTKSKIARKILPVIYVIDTSGSMSGTRISAVNQAMSETIDVLKEVSKKNPTAELKIGVLKFASGAEWITGEDDLVFMDDFYWSDLSAGGVTDLGSALNELFNKLSRSSLLKDDIGYKVPVIIFMSDGGPTDDYKSALLKINNNNNWYKAATKIALAIDDGTDIDVLAEITGNTESVIQVSDMETLKKLIKVVSVTASMIGSKSRTDSDSTGDILRAVGDGMKGDAGVVINPSDSGVDPEPTVGGDSGSDDSWDTTGDWD